MIVYHFHIIIIIIFPLIKWIHFCNNLFIFRETITSKNTLDCEIDIYINIDIIDCFDRFRLFDNDDDNDINCNLP